jgi:hypothetical protein
MAFTPFRRSRIYLAIRADMRDRIGRIPMFIDEMRNAIRGGNGKEYSWQWRTRQ